MHHKVQEEGVHGTNFTNNSVDLFTAEYVQ